MSEVAKFSEHSEEWRIISEFFEWLKENRMCIGVWPNPEADYEELDGSITKMKDRPWVMENPRPLGVPYEDLLFRYFEIDPYKLEMQRRRILENLGKESERK